MCKAGRPLSSGCPCSQHHGTWPWHCARLCSPVLSAGAWCLCCETPQPPCAGCFGAWTALAGQDFIPQAHPKPSIMGPGWWVMPCAALHPFAGRFQRAKLPVPNFPPQGTRSLAPFLPLWGRREKGGSPPEQSLLMLPQHT